MKLEDFRAQLESEAKTRCEQQEITIKGLHEEITRLKNQILCERENQGKQIEQLQNRCYVQTHGALCLFCGFKEECKHG